MKIITAMILVLCLANINSNTAYAQDTDKHLEWSSSLQGNVTIRYLEHDSLGNEYVLGTFSGALSFPNDTTVATLTSNGSQDVFIVKMDAIGNLIWAKNIGGTSTEFPTGLDVDDSMNVYFTGNFTYTMDADPNAGVYTLPDPSSNSSFIIKLDINGDFSWANSFGNTGAARVNDLVISSNNKLFIVGRYAGTATVRSSWPDIVVDTSNGSYDGFVASFETSSGLFNWSQHYGSTFFDEFKEVQLDDQGNICIQGLTQGSYDLDPDSGGVMINATTRDLLICKIDTTGSLFWGFSIDHSVGTETITAEQYSHGYTAVLMRMSGGGNAAFPMDTGIYQYPLITTSSNFILGKVNNASGTFDWIRPMELGNAYFIGIDLDHKDNIYLYGDLSDDWADLDPGNGIFSIDSSEVRGFVSKLDKTGSFINAYVWKNRLNAMDVNLETLYTGVYIHNAFDADASYNETTIPYSTNMFVLLKHGPCLSSSYDSITVCDSYEKFLGGSYTVDGSYIDTLINTNGCDSMLSFDLTVLHSSFDSLIIESCIEYTSPSGNYIRDYSGIFYDTITNVVGCDSVLKIDLTIKPVEMGIGIDGSTLITEYEGDTYQWLDCEDGLSPIINATEAQFDPPSTGEYAVQIEQDGCIDTSLCYASVVINSINEDLNNSLLQVYPNPSNGTIFLSFNQDQPNVELQIKSLDGRILFSKSGFYSNKQALDVQLPKGIYLLMIKMDNGKMGVEKIIIN